MTIHTNDGTDLARLVDGLIDDTYSLLYEADLVEEHAADRQRDITEAYELTDDGRYVRMPELDDYYDDYCPDYDCYMYCDAGLDENAPQRWTEAEVAFANSYGEWQRDRYLDQEEAKDLAESARDREQVASQATHATRELSDTSPYRILRDAIDYLERYGWTQYKAYEYIDRTAERPAACATGAIDTVSGRADLAAYAVACAAVRALATSLVAHHHLVDDQSTGKRWCWDVVQQWNDQAGRTKAEVLSAMWQAAADWREHNYPEVRS